MKEKIIERYSIKDIVTFKPNKFLPIYNWLYYKEGFSREFMEYAYNKLKISSNDVILDPFVGVGTSAVYAKERGNIFYGIDTNEVAIFASRVKTRDYDIEILKKLSLKVWKSPSREEIKQAEKEIEEIKMNIIHKAFPYEVLKDILAYKNKIESTIENKKYRDFFILALMNTSTITTYAQKEGGSIKINKKRKFPPVKRVFKEKIKRMIKDLQSINFKGKEKDIVIIQGDAREMYKYIPEKINVLITSPPYLNKIEYTNVYAIEQYLFLNRTISYPAVRSYIGKDVKEEEDIFKGKYPMNNISKAYFKDMNKVLDNILKISSLSLKGAIVIGNGCFPNGVVESDLLLSELMENKGLEIIEIERVNKRWCMRNRVIKVAPMHESIIWFKKRD